MRLSLRHLRLQAMSPTSTLMTTPSLGPIRHRRLARPRGMVRKPPMKDHPHVHAGL